MSDPTEPSPRGQVRADGTRRRMVLVPLTLAAVALGATLTAGCSSGDSGDAERFCGEVAENRDALVNPELAYSDDIEPLLDLYRKVGDTAPLAVEDDWNQLVSAYETASTVVVGDAESEQDALAAIYSSEKSAVAIDNWLRANCAVDIGPVFTIVAQTPVTAPPPPPASTPPAGSTPPATATVPAP